MKITKFKTDKTKEQSGTWVDAGSGLRLKIARVGNPAYIECVQHLGKPHRMAARHGTVDVATTEKIVRTAVSRHILLGWENLEDEAGKPIPYSQDKAFELLTEHRDFYTLVMEFAQDADLFKQEELEDARGNSEAVSAGNSSGDSKSSF